jgi:4,5-dihydroxyphthalate decarboxylase
MNHDHVQPLKTKEVASERLEVTVDTAVSIKDAWSDLAFGGFEYSFLHYVMEAADGHTTHVGLPVFLRRAFGFRSVYVLRESQLSSARELVGKRVGINMWEGSGNLWARAALRFQGVDLEEIAWVVGPLKENDFTIEEDVPTYVTRAPEEVYLLDLLKAGDLDAVVYPTRPDGFFTEAKPFRHLLTNYPEHEADYYRKTGIYPAEHILTIRREVAESTPWIISELCEVFDKSRTTWEATRRFLGDTSPWVIADIERAVDTMGDDWQPNGIEPNRAMLTGICQEVWEQGFTSAVVDPGVLFAECEALRADAVPA